MHDRSRNSRGTPSTIQVVHNVHHERDIHYATQLARYILMTIGIWNLVYARSSHTEKALSVMTMLVCIAILSFVLVPSMSYVLFSSIDNSTRAKLIAPVFFCLTSSAKYYFLGRNGGKIGKCIERMEADWQIVEYDDHRKTMLNNATVGRRLTAMSVIFLYIGGMSYHIVLPLSTMREFNGNFTTKPLIYRGYDKYFDSHASPAYDIVFSIHCISAMIQYAITTAACSLSAIFVMHACGQVQVLMTMLRDLVEGERNKGTTVQHRLGLIVKRHVSMLRFTIDVEELMREICLLELVASSFLICMLEYYFMSEWENSDVIGITTFIVLFVSFSFNFLIFCYIGELLMEEYSKVGSAMYEINWYDLPGHKAFDFVMIITMSQYPPKLTAGKFVDLSVSTFSSVLRTSIVYFNLLRTVA